MGSTLAQMQQDLTLIDTDSSRDARETLDRLEDIARDRFDHFYQKICYSRPDKHHIRMKNVLNKYAYIGVAAEGDNLIWMDEVKEVVKEFSIGPFTDGLSSVATDTILKMTYPKTEKYQTQQKFTISLNAHGRVSRLDYFIFNYTFSSTELARRKASLIAFCVIESSAVVKDIDANTLRVMINGVFRGRNTRRTTLTAIYNQFAMAINRPVGSLSLAEKEKEKEGLESLSWREPINRELPAGGNSSGGDIVALLSILSIVESVEVIVREVVALSAQLTMLRCVTVRIQGVHKAACGGGCCRCTSELCSHACSLSQEYHMKRHVIPRLCGERESVVPSPPLAENQKENLEKSLPPTRISMVRKA